MTDHSCPDCGDSLHELGVEGGETVYQCTQGHVHSEGDLRRRLYGG